jgi:hypothetical protein
VNSFDPDCDAISPVVLDGRHGARKKQSRACRKNKAVESANPLWKTNIYRET